MQEQADIIEQIARTLVTCLGRGGKVILFGNGGSAADVQHIAAELNGKYLLQRPSLPVLSLITNSSTLTTIANDYGFDQVFSRQIETWALSGDVAIGITTSGKSPNVIEALRVAKVKGPITVGLCGQYCDCIGEVAEYLS